MLDSDIVKGLRVRIKQPADPHKAIALATGNNWSWAIAGYDQTLDGATGTVGNRSASGYNWVVMLDRPWVVGLSGLVYPALTMNAEWLEHEVIFTNTGKAGSVVITLPPREVIGSQSREYNGFCNPQEHPEFSGHCGRLHAHSVGCPTRRKKP